MGNPNPNEYGTKRLNDWDIPSDSLRTLDVVGVRGSISVPFEPLKNAVNSSPWINETDRDVLIGGLISGYLPYIRPILLPLLPNLRTLKLEVSYGQSEIFLQHAMRKAIDMYSISGTCGAFEKLVAVDLVMECPPLTSLHVDPRRTGYAFKFLALIMALPSIRKVTTSGISELAFERETGSPMSRVTHIKLLNQDIMAAAFQNLIEGGVALEDVHLTVRSNAICFQEEDFGKVLLANAKFSLQKIVLLYEGKNAAPSASIQLQGFRKLKDVAIRFGHAQLEEQKKLVDLLPSSLERLEIHMLKKTQEILENIVEVLEAKRRFPRMKELVICKKLNRKEKDRFIALCEKNTIGCSFE
jgi:hypothetical protein